jgi:hypothetical protein
VDGTIEKGNYGQRLFEKVTANGVSPCLGEITEQIEVDFFPLAGLSTIVETYETAELIFVGK